jgi:hypothetical protein
MSFNFPSPATEGQVVTFVEGPSYRYSNGVWNRYSQAVGQTAEARNRIVNGGMQVSQEWGNTAGNSSGFYAADQWMLGFVSSSAVASARRPRTVGGFDFLATWTSPLETAAAAGEYVYSTQSIEGTRLADFGLGTAGSKAFVISFDAKMTVAGTYWVTIRNSPVTHSFLASYAISAGEVGTWVRKTIVVPAGAISAGTWTVDNTAGMILAFTFHCGSTFTGVAGFQAGNILAGPGQALGLSVAASDAVAIANVGLYLDKNFTGVPPPWQMPDEAEELRACQRYWENSSLVYLDAALNGTSGVKGRSVEFKVTKRAAPTIGRVDVGGATTFDTTNVNSFRIFNSVVTNVTASWTASARM